MMKIRELILSKKWARAYPGAGYGGFFYFWMTSEDRKPYDSCGNGSAMRVSPAGFYAKNEKDVLKLASAITRVTHKSKIN